jgi:hypothetical protein
MPVSKIPHATAARKVASPSPKAAMPVRAAALPARKTTRSAAATAAPATEANREPKDKKVKLVRDSISIPKNEYEVLTDLKLRAGKLGVLVKKTEVLRAGIKALAAMPNPAFAAALRAVPSLKTGRPAKTD